MQIPGTTRRGLRETEINCGCGGSQQVGEFDAKTAIDQLARKLEQLGTVVAQYMARREEEHPIRAARGINAEGVQPRHFADAVTRIVGGVPVATGEFPECCLVGRRSANGIISWFCSGVLIHPKIVVTAAHCFIPSRRANVIALRAEDEDHLQSAEIVSVRRIIPHPQYRLTALHDISVIVLRRAATVAPVAAATTAQTLAAMETTLVGFGNDDLMSTRGFGIKRKVRVPITNIEGRGDGDDAEQELGFESDVEFVAGGLGFDSCNGDSGGPAYIDAGGQRVVAGLTSRSTETARNPCGEGGIYTRLDQNMDFVRDVAASAGITV